MFQSTKAVLDALQAALEALVFPDDNLVLPGEALFESVAQYASTDIEQAITDLINYDDRICVVVPLPERFDDSQSGQVLRTAYTQEFVVLVSDQSFEQAASAFLGNDDTPGVLAMKDVVIPALVGNTLGLKNVVLTVKHAESYRAKNPDADKSREGYLIYLSTPMGTVKTELPRGRKS